MCIRDRGRPIGSAAAIKFSLLQLYFPFFGWRQSSWAVSIFNTLNRFYPLADWFTSAECHSHLCKMSGGLDQPPSLEQSACCTSNVGPHPQLVQARPEDAPVLLFCGTVNLHHRPALLWHQLWRESGAVYKCSDLVTYLLTARQTAAESQSVHGSSTMMQ